jgi:hypothetical protein
MLCSIVTVINFQGKFWPAAVLRTEVFRSREVIKQFFEVNNGHFSVY